MSQYCASLSLFNARVKAAKILLESGATPAEVREIHGAFVLRVAKQELELIQKQRSLKNR